MRLSLTLSLLLIVACTRSPAPTGLTLEQQRELALAVPEGDADLARAAKAAQDAPGLAERWVALGQQWLRKARASNDPGHSLSAEGAAQVALSLQPENGSATALEALVSLSQHRFTRARDLAKVALQRRDDDLLALSALADATLELGDVAASTDAVQRMVDLKPSLPSYGRAAHLRWLHGDVAGAAALYRHAMDAGQSSKDPEPRAWLAVQLAIIFLEQGDLDGAEAGFEFALARVRNYPPALVGQARVRLSRGDAASAVGLLERAVKASPLVESWVLLAEAREAALDAVGARAAWASAERLGRERDPLALARGWAEAGVHGREAVSLLQAERLVRANAQVEGALAWAYFREGNLDAAVEASERALALGTGEAKVRYQHAAILAARGQHQPALEELEALTPRMSALTPRLRNEAQELLRALRAQLAVKG